MPAPLTVARSSTCTSGWPAEPWTTSSSRSTGGTSPPWTARTGGLGGRRVGRGGPNPQPAHHRAGLPRRAGGARGRRRRAARRWGARSCRRRRRRLEPAGHVIAPHHAARSGARPRWTGPRGGVVGPAPPSELERGRRPRRVDRRWDRAVPRRRRPALRRGDHLTAQHHLVQDRVRTTFSAPVSAARPNTS